MFGAARLALGKMLPLASAAPAVALCPSLTASSIAFNLNVSLRVSHDEGVCVKTTDSVFFYA